MIAFGSDFALTERASFDGFVVHRRGFARSRIKSLGDAVHRFRRTWNFVPNLEVLMKSARVLVASLVVAGVVVSSAGEARAASRQQTDAPTSAGSIAGKWNLRVGSPQGGVESVLTLTVDGAKVSGSIVGPLGELPVAGQFTEGKLIFSMDFPSQNGALKVQFAGALKPDGTLAGNIDFGGQASPWTAVRTKP